MGRPQPTQRRLPLRMVGSALIVLGACGGTPGDVVPGSTDPTPHTDTTTEETMPESESTVPAAVIASAMVQDAIDDVVERTGADRSSIEVVSVEEVDWPDGSIGCPQPDMAYTQSIVNGTRIVLRHDGVEDAYHQGGRRSVFFCPPDRATGNSIPPSSDLDI